MCPVWLLILLAIAAAPASAQTRIELTAGLIVDPNDGADGSHAGPALSVGASTPSLPFFVEAGVGRVDFVSLGQPYHNNHLFLALGLEWVPRRGKTALGFRLGVGAHRESQVVEGDPPRGGGTNWAEMVLPGLSVVREVSGGREVVVTISDALLGPFYAVLDPEEYGVEHRLRLMIGLRF